MESFAGSLQLPGEAGAGLVLIGAHKAPLDWSQVLGMENGAGNLVGLVMQPTPGGKRYPKSR